MGEVELDYKPLSAYCHCDVLEDKVVQVPAEEGVHLLSRCGHPIHLSCLQKLAKGRKGEKMYQCPACRSDIPFHEDSPDIWRQKYGFWPQDHCQAIPFFPW